MIQNALATVGRIPKHFFYTLLIVFGIGPLLFVAIEQLDERSPQTAALIVCATLAASFLIASSQIQRSQVEHQLAARQRQTQAILDASADAYVAMDSAGRIIAWSGQATHTFGWTASEAIGKTVSALIIPPDLRSSHDGGLERYLSTGHGPVLGTRVEVEAQHRDGHQFPIELAVWSVENEEGPTFVSFIHDITERRQKEVDYKAARDRAMQASQLKSQFVANVSHEIRTPMNGVIGMAEILAKTDLTEDQREHLDTIRMSAYALLDVINDILDFSKIEAGKFELEQQNFDLRGVVEDVGALLASTAQSKGVELITSVDASLPAVVRGDAGRLRQVLLNIAGNAVKFTDVGEVLISVSLDNEQDEEMFLFVVRDTGPGISKEHQQMLFESFSQGDASSTRGHGGTGLGLSISKRLIELMGGSIDFESDLGVGSTFCFTVKFQARPEVSPAYPRLDAMARLPVLIVDDNATTRKMLSQTLAGWGVAPYEAANAEDAIELLEARRLAGKPFAVALLDHHMPDRNGVELAGAMASDTRFAEVKRVLLSLIGDQSELAEHGFARRLTKPVRVSALFECIASFAAVEQSATTLGPTGDTKLELPPRTGRILLAEDNQVNQMVARHMLTNLGYEVDVVSDGIEAMNAVANETYDAVLMDCQMPLMDGYEATACIRDQQTGVDRIPIIAMTASAMEGDAERCFAAGMDAYLTKPVRVAELDALLSQWVPQAKGR